MSRLKLVMLSVFAVFAFSAVASSAASADLCSGGTQPLFCFSPSNTPIHELAVSGTSGASILASHVAGVEVVLNCTHSTFGGTLKLLGLAKGEIDFLGCTVEKPAGQGCEVGEGVNHLIPAKVHIQLNAATMVTGLATGEGPGEEFTTLTIGGPATCKVLGVFQVTGLQTLEFPNAETSATEHEIVAKKSGSKLKLGVETASFSSTSKVHLHSNATWLVMLGV